MSVIQAGSNHALYRRLLHAHFLKVRNAMLYVNNIITWLEGERNTRGIMRWSGGFCEQSTRQSETERTQDAPKVSRYRLEPERR